MFAVIPTSSCSAEIRHDANPRRIRAWTETMSRSKKRLFDDFYGSRHFHLQVLATHPDFQRKGAGSMLVIWGTRKAERTGMAISLFASPMGQMLYTNLGFEVVERVTVNADEEEEWVTLSAMIFVPRIRIKQSKPLVDTGHRQWRASSRRHHLQQRQKWSASNRVQLV